MLFTKFEKDTNDLPVTRSFFILSLHAYKLGVEKWLKKGTSLSQMKQNGLLLLGCTIQVLVLITACPGIVYHLVEAISSADSSFRPSCPANQASSGSTIFFNNRISTPDSVLGKPLGRASSWSANRSYTPSVMSRLLHSFACLSAMLSTLSFILIWDFPFQFVMKHPDLHCFVTNNMPMAPGCQ